MIFERALRPSHTNGIFTILIILTLLLPASFAAENFFVFDSSTSSAFPTEPLQFTSGGHVLSFEADGVYLATGDHVLHEKFVGTVGLTPFATYSGTTDGQIQPLETVTYPEIWDGITLVYDRPLTGIVRSTFHINAGADPGQIGLQYNVPVNLDESGNMVFEFPTGSLSASAPIAW
jgi:hypothetical protein